MKLLRIVLLPFSALYWLVLRIRHFLYDQKILSSHYFTSPKTICVGNLNTGGTGKTPFTLFLTKLIGDSNQVAVLSRGYKRKTAGFILADRESTSDDIGDEPLLLYRHLKEAHVAVDANRKRGIEYLRKLVNPAIVILDDAFQHRRVNAGLNILLTDYHNRYTRQWLLPAGPLRDIRHRAKDAQIIVVTKCPSAPDFNALLREIKPRPHQKVFFTRFRYHQLKPLHGDQIFEPDFIDNKSLLLVTGIARPKYLETYLRQKAGILKTVNFNDHHDYSPRDLQRITEIFDNFEPSPKLVITTEKDAVKLNDPSLAPLLLKLPIFVLTVEIEFLKDEEVFEREVKRYVKEN